MQICRARAAAKVLPARGRRALTLLLCLFFGSTLSRAAEFPQAVISNGQITAKIYLPDAAHGYYHSTRFDWSGAVYSLQYKGHEYYGPWFDRVNPKVNDWVHQGAETVVGPRSATQGPVDEFAIPLGWDSARPGGTFVKIGVGVLKSTGTKYDHYFPYEVLDPGKWSVVKHRDSIEFRQELSDPDSGYAYVYRKVVKLTKGKPEMTIEHSLKNTGRLEIKSSVYNHNFLVLDKQPPGPDFAIRLPFQIQSAQQPNKELAEIRGNEIVYKKVLSGEDQAVVNIQGFGDSSSDNEITVENKKVGAGLRMRGDRPIVREFLWSIRTVLALEPYVDLDVQPGAEFTWKNTYEYYTLPAGK